MLTFTVEIGVYAVQKNPLVILPPTKVTNRVPSLDHNKARDTYESLYSNTIFKIQNLWVNIVYISHKFYVFLLKIVSIQYLFPICPLDDETNCVFQRHNKIKWWLV